LKHQARQAHRSGSLAAAAQGSFMKTVIGLSEEQMDARSDPKILLFDLAQAGQYFTA
jgi:hypothetical protein